MGETSGLGILRQSSRLVGVESGSGPSAAADMSRFVWERYDRRSLWALGLLVLTGAAVGYRWSDLLDVNGTMDWLLAGIWTGMAALLAWNVSARRDLLLLAVGLVGGAVIEWWGTTTLLWHYFTDERPPLWILPAWPVAAVTTDRLARMLEEGLRLIEARRGQFSPRLVTASYWLVVPSFVAGMFVFAWPSVHITSTRVVFALMVVLTLFGRDHRRDVVVFVAGAGLGIFLEYWGTSRQCWTYYTREVPPLMAVLAHGFAAIAFIRGGDLLERLATRLWPRYRQLEKTCS